MSDTQDPKNSRQGMIRFALLAGVLGLAAGAGLYAFFATTGNVEKKLASATGDQAANCTIDKKLQTDLDAAANGHVAAFKALDRPYSVAAFKFNNRDGTAISLGDWSGKTVLLNLWATWCAPCRAEMPALDSLQGQLGGDSFEVVPISVDLGDPAKPKKFYTDIDLKNLGFFHDPDLKILNTLKKNGLAFGLPATLLIDTRGCVLGALNGPAEWDHDDAKKLINAAL